MDATFWTMAAVTLTCLVWVLVQEHRIKRMADAHAAVWDGYEVRGERLAQLRADVSARDATITRLTSEATDKLVTGDGSLSATIEAKDADGTVRAVTKLDYELLAVSLWREAGNVTPWTGRPAMPRDAHGRFTKSAA